MKKSLLIVIAICFATIGKSQITLEYTYTGCDQVSIIDLAASGEKYLWNNISNNEFRLYNMDHSIYKIVDIPSSINTSFFPLLYYVTEHLFDLDDGVEYALAYYDTSTTAYFTIIIDEDKSTLLTPDTGIASITNTSMGIKMIIGTNGQDTWNVYNLPGTELKSISIDPAKNELSSYPNPASKYTTINYQLPAGDIFGEIKIFNSSGVFIKSFNVDDNFNSLIVDTSDMQSGSYYYILSSSSGKNKGQKLIIVQ